LPVDVDSSRDLARRRDAIVLTGLAMIPLLGTGTGTGTGLARVVGNLMRCGTARRQNAAG
jgi:hypothetical protein